MFKNILILLALLFSANHYSQCYKMVATGGYYTLALETNGTLWSWGYNQFGQLGIGSTVSTTSPVQIGSDNDWKYINASADCSYAIKEDGTLWAWGSNYFGQVGNGNNTDVYAPVQIGTDADWKIIASGSYHALAMKENGTLWSWGSNQFGQLGDGSYTWKNTPAQVGDDDDWKSISGGYRHTFAIKNNGSLWGWGENNFGALGDGSTINKNLPVQIGTSVDWKCAAAGNTVTLAIKNDNTLWAWGHNFSGCFGDNYASGDAGSPIPIQIGSANTWESISCGISPQTLAIKTDGSLWSWGFNNNGQLGIGSSANTFSLNDISGGLVWNSANSGVYHSAAISQDGTIVTFGDNGYGAIGDGTYIDKFSPFTVSCMQPLEVSNNILTRLEIYPNPFTDRVHFNSDKTISSIEVIDNLGRCILQPEVSIHNGQAELDLSAITQSGVYLLKVTSADKTEVARIIRK